VQRFFAARRGGWWRRRRRRRLRQRRRRRRRREERVTAVQSRCGRGCSSLSARRAVHVRGSRSTWGELSAAIARASSLTSLSRAVEIHIHIYIYTPVCRGWLPPWKHEGDATRRRGGGVRVPVSERRRRVRSSDRRCPFSISFVLSLSFPLLFSRFLALVPFLFLLFPPRVFPLSRLRGRRRAGGRK